MILSFRQFIPLAFCLFFSLSLFAQGNNFGDTEPVIDCPTDLTVCTDETTGPFNVSTMSNLPNMEYAIIDHSLPAPSGTGDAVVGFDEDGIFLPSDFNIAPGSSFGVVPVAYDLNSIQETLDDILKGSITILFVTTSCCDLAASQGSTVCADLNGAGIFCGSDVSSLSAVSNLSSGTSDTLSLIDFIAEIDAANAQLSDPALPAQCGGGDMIAYAYGNECTFDTKPDTLMLTMPHTMSETVEATELLTSNTIIEGTYTVAYQAQICIELTPGFETVIGADFTAEITTICP